MDNKLKERSLLDAEDIRGVSFEDDVWNHIPAIKKLVEGLLGKGSIENSKTKRDEEGGLEVIGYEIRLQERVVGIAPKNVKKSFYAAFAVEEGRNVPQTQIQRTALYASRYKRICQSGYSHTVKGFNGRTPEHGRSLGPGISGWRLRQPPGQAQAFQAKVG